ncbi:hypothetical protein D3C86_1783150 [compost metagenome]
MKVAIVFATDSVGNADVAVDRQEYNLSNILQFSVQNCQQFALTIHPFSSHAYIKMNQHQPQAHVPTTTSQNETTLSV